MKRETAEEIIDATRRIDLILGELHFIGEDIDDAAEKKKLQKATAEIILAVYEKITLDVANQFPDLHPSKNPD